MMREMIQNGKVTLADVNQMETEGKFPNGMVNAAGRVFGYVSPHAVDGIAPIDAALTAPITEVNTVAMGQLAVGGFEPNRNQGLEQISDDAGDTDMSVAVVDQTSDGLPTGANGEFAILPTGANGEFVIQHCSV